MNRNAVIITSVGLVIGVAEALLYRSLGESAGGKFVFKIPPPKEFATTIAVVFFTSILTAAITNGIESMLPEDKKVPA